MTSLQTKPSLLLKLKESVSNDLTAEELRRQRISYVMGTLKETSTVTPSQINKVLDHQEGKKTAA